MTTETVDGGDEELAPTFGAKMRAIAAVPVRLVGALLMPDRWLGPQVVAGRYGAALITVVVCALLQAAAVGLRLDVAPDIMAEAAAAATVKPDDDPNTTPETKSDREVEEEITRTLAVKRVTAALGAGIGTPINILVFAVVIYLLLRFVKGTPTMPRALAVASHAALPGAVKALVAATAAFKQTAVTPAQAAELVHNPLASTWAAAGPLVARLGAGVDPFLLWSVLLVGFGSAAAGEVSKRRAFITVIVVFLLYLAITRLVAGGPPPMPPGGGPPAQGPA
jgi:hypothetical protein